VSKHIILLIVLAS